MQIRDILYIHIINLNKEGHKMHYLFGCIFRQNLKIHPNYLLRIGKSIYTHAQNATKVEIVALSESKPCEIDIKNYQCYKNIFF